jgi:hypothetical protein
MRTWILLFGLCLIISSGCGSGESGSETAPPDRLSDATQHAPADVVPGSHEDWCGEHQVPETLCTRCHPDLIPAFQASGDWCQEHGLPESQCLACNPDLVIQRPPKPGDE